ncbi:MAG: hypothetical protein HYY40_13550 [Bacteroidetes bacterium]|nr:hypothetical protein [Bacteroidota bacterium]
MQTILIRSEQKATSDFIIEMAKRIRVKARVLSEDELEDLRLNKLLREDENDLTEVNPDKVYRTLRKYGAKI